MAGEAFRVLVRYPGHPVARLHEWQVYTSNHNGGTHSYPSEAAAKNAIAQARWGGRDQEFKIQRTAIEWEDVTETPPAPEATS